QHRRRRREACLDNYVSRELCQEVSLENGVLPWFARSRRSWQAGAMTWTVPTPSPVDGPMTGDDRPILEGYLNYQRSTLLNICAGLTGEQLARRPIPSSNLSLLGLIRH